MSGGLVDVSGAHPTPVVQRSRTFLVIHYVTYVGISAHAVFVGLFFWMRVPALALFNIYSVASWAAARTANRRLMPRLATLLLAVEVVGHAVLASYLLGWDSGFHYYLVPVIPFLMFNDQLANRTVIGGSVGVGLIYLVLRATTTHAVPPPGWVENAAWFEYLNIITPLSALGIISIYFRFGSIDAERRMEALAMTDALTKLPNRRRMRELLEAERARFSRSGRAFAVILGDVDGFKHINDTLGHDCGDYVLRELAAVMRAGLRGQDAVARWGGEEFLFLLPDTDIAGAGILAEKLRQAVERANVTFAGQKLPVTMTFGVSAYNRNSSADECIRRADQALYAGKNQGKNRIMLGAGAA